MYGEVLAGNRMEPLDKELKSIIGNGYAVMYIIAQKLVWKSNADGYLVGSRGSCRFFFSGNHVWNHRGKSSAAPHYYCAHCKYSDFDSPEVKTYGGQAGCDMPDRRCPNCGKQ